MSGSVERRRGGAALRRGVGAAHLAQQGRIDVFQVFAAAQRVEHVQQDVDRRWAPSKAAASSGTGAAAGDVDAVLDGVAQLHHRRQVEEAGAALDGVEAAEHGVEA